MEVLQIAALCLMIGGISSDIVGDPCDPAFPVTVVIEDFERSAGHNIADGEKSDRYLAEGWYRFIGPQGNDMVTANPGQGQCGCMFPIWLNGEIPSEADGIVNAQACVPSLTGGDCDHSYEIQIRNCGEHRLYYLHPAEDGQQEAYCIGTEVPCPENEYSENSHYTPGCRPDVDECVTDNGGCDHTCVNDVLAYTCSCNPGYTLDADGHTCTDNDECADNNGGCAQNCDNTPGSFECGCDAGYTINDDGFSCDDNDECATDNGGCAHSCHNSVGSYECGCNPGYRLNGDGHGCDDIDECAENTHNCDHTCTNSPGSFQCSCNDGWQLNGDDHSCDDIDECATNNGGCAQTCDNNLGSYQCGCNAGYTLNADGHACDDVNECETNNGGCDHTCTNSVGAYSCSCNPGYSLNGDDHACDDIDECDTNNGGCEQKCDNLPGSYVCSCNGGFVLNADNHACDDVDECATNNGGCEQNCDNSRGSYSCNCDAGYSLDADAHSCNDIDECATLNGGCSHSCTNNVGSYECGCHSGYYIDADGHRCHDIDECDSNNGDCEQKCANNPGSYVCSCNDGFVLADNNWECHDIDECAAGDDDCEQVCNNAEPFWTCACNAGYQLNPDGKTCSNINECETDNGGCSHTCTDNVGSFVCSCPAGWTIGLGGLNCIDVNECADGNNGGCSHTCVNTAGSYHCDCPSGMRLKPDGSTCISLAPELIGDDGYISWRVDQKTISLYNSLTMRELTMLCNMEWAGADLIYDVTWYIGDRSNEVKRETLNSANMPAELHEEDWNSQGGAQQNVYCDMTARWYEGWDDSNTVPLVYFMGFEVDELNLVAEEGGDPAEYVVRPTVPVLCPVGYESYCSLSLEVHTPVTEDNTNNPAVCRNGEVIDQGVIEFHQTPCRLEIPYFEDIPAGLHWSLPISAAIDSSYDKDVELRVDVRGPDVYQFHRFWEGVVLPSAKVSIMDHDADLARRVCKARNDPHMTTFDGRIYENQLEGEFILYKNTRVAVEVRAWFMQCNRYATCLAAIAVRAGGDFFLYDISRIFGGNIRVQMYECEDGTMIVQQINSRRYRITLGTGTVIEADRGWVTVTPSVSDWNNVEGLCGSLDGDCGNEFMLNGGGYSTDAKARNSQCDNRNGWDRWFHPDDFSSSWRVSPLDSWFNGLPFDDRAPIQGTVYCSCNEDEEAVCKTGAAGATVVEHCIQNESPHMQRCLSRKKRSNHGDHVEEYVEFTYDPDFKPEEPTWRNGMTEEDAVEHCTEVIGGDAGLQGAATFLPDVVPGAIDACVGDVLLSGSTDYTLVHLEDARNDVARELEKNVSLYTYSNGRYHAPAQLAQFLCPNQCSGNGQCVDGACVCNTGFADMDCGQQLGHLPELSSLPTNGMCDLQNRSCEETPVYGNYFVANDDLTCQVTPVVVVDGQQVEQPVVTSSASYDHENKVWCDLPPVEDDSGTAYVYGYRVSVSNNGEQYPEAKTVTVYDGACVGCEPHSDLVCYLKADTCYVNSKCYVQGQASDTDSCQVCDSSQSQTSFSAGDGCGGGANSGLVAGVAVAVVAACVAVVIGSAVYIVYRKKKMNKVSDLKEAWNPKA